MMVLIDFPSLVKHYASYFEECFTPKGYEHFKKAVSGFIISENKTLEGINRMYLNDPKDQSSFNRFFSGQNFDLVQVNRCRMSMLQDNEATQFKPGKGQGVISIDNTLLKHYGKYFDNIYYHYDYIGKNYRWAHDLVTLYYSDDQTDYPIDYKLWDPPNWEAVADYLKEQDFTINEDKWKKRETEPQQWRNYIRSRYRAGCKKFPGVKTLYKTKLHIAEELLEKFCEEYPSMKFPVALDSGYTSASLCEQITNRFGMDYVGALREDQAVFISGEKTLLKDLVQSIRDDHASEGNKYTIQKTGYSYRGKKQYAYTYHINCKVNHFQKKQRLVISFTKENLSSKPNFSITNRTDWYPSGILRIRRHRWPIETFHQEGKVEGLEKYQVRNEKAIQTYIALVVVAYSMLKCTVHNADLLSNIQQRLQTELDSTLPFLRRMFRAEGVLNLMEHIVNQFAEGQDLRNFFNPIAKRMAYVG